MFVNPIGQPTLFLLPPPAWTEGWKCRPWPTGAQSLMHENSRIPLNERLSRSPRPGQVSKNRCIWKASWNLQDLSFRQNPMKTKVVAVTQYKISNKNKKKHEPWIHTSSCPGYMPHLKSVTMTHPWDLCLFYHQVLMIMISNIYIYTVYIFC